MLNNLSDFIGFLEILDLFPQDFTQQLLSQAHFSVDLGQHHPNSGIILEKRQNKLLSNCKQNKKLKGLRNAQWLSIVLLTLQTRNKILITDWLYYPKSRLQLSITLDSISSVVSGLEN